MLKQTSRNFPNISYKNFSSVLEIVDCSFSEILKESLNNSKTTFFLISIGIKDIV